MPSVPSQFNRQEIERIVGSNPSLIRKFEQMMIQTTEVLPDQFESVTVLASIAGQLASDAREAAQAAQNSADDAAQLRALIDESWQRFADIESLIGVLQAGLQSIGPDNADPLGSFQAVAASNIAIGQLVNVYNDAGTVKVRLADAGPSQYEAHGFATRAVTATYRGVFNSIGNVTLSGLTIGAYYYLSDATPGAVTTTAPVTIGNVIQQVGVAVSTTQLAFKAVQGIIIT